MLYFLGIKHGLGSDSLCEYFQKLRLEEHLDISADSLRKQGQNVLDALIALFSGNPTPLLLQPDQ